MVDSIVVAASTPGTVLRYAAAFFLVVVAIGLVIALIRLAQTLNRVDKLVEDTDREMVPLLSRAQVTLDQVNSELGKVDEILASAVNVTSKVDATTNAVSSVVSAPAKKAAAFSAGVSQAVSSFFARHDDGAAGAAADPSATSPPPGGSSWSRGPDSGTPATGTEAATDGARSSEAATRVTASSVLTGASDAIPADATPGKTGTP
ncbi:MAG TPA: hypothetical protein VJ787_02000 [Thermoleophilia bacterium]|nr:hypothetical protein [Thermoleophilia bacterium]